jgi:hypothetical protein
MNRRQFLKSLGFGAVWMAGLGAVKAYAETMKPGAQGHPKPAAKARPPATCGGWADSDANGICDRSVNGPKPCTAIRCPGNVGNKDRLAGAPAGACALWKDSEKKGFCSVCLEKKPCLYSVCPAHKDHRGA